MSKLSINQWDLADRPREKLAEKGPAVLSNAELLAILIGSGTPDESAVDLMRHILDDCKNSLNALGKMDIPQLCQYKGIGPAKAITIIAACEFGKEGGGSACPASQYQEFTGHLPADDAYTEGPPQKRLMCSCSNNQ
ncbi:DNA repair protein RadC, partial [gut metagenome]